MGLWSTDGKTYEDWIRRLTSTIIRDEYARHKKNAENANNGDENFLYSITLFYSFIMFLVILQ